MSRNIGDGKIVATRVCEEEEDEDEFINWDDSVNFDDTDTDTSFQSDQFKRLQNGDGNPQGCTV